MSEMNIQIPRPPHPLRTVERVLAWSEQHPRLATVADSGANIALLLVLLLTLRSVAEDTHGVAASIALGAVAGIAWVLYGIKEQIRGAADQWPLRLCAVDIVETAVGDNILECACDGSADKGRDA